jgi:hypothetical protein
VWLQHALANRIALLGQRNRINELVGGYRLLIDEMIF